MSLTLCLAIYFVTWWITLFAVMPIGLRTQEEEGEIVPGTSESAPAKFRLLRTFLINSVVAAVVFAFIWVIVTYGLIDVGAFKPPAALNN